MSFEQAITVTPVGPSPLGQRYTAHLQDEWSIGRVPHGGYTAAILYRLATTHFAHMHSTQFPEMPVPISMQISYLRRTRAGEALLTVQDAKIGRRTSTIHVTLSQRKGSDNSDSSSSSSSSDYETKVAGYITVSPPGAEQGVSALTRWSPSPPVVKGTGPSGEVNLAALAATGSDGVWKRSTPPFSAFRRATQHADLYAPGKESKESKESTGSNSSSHVIDQWARFCPYGILTPWTDEGVAFLTDIFPTALDGLQSIALNSSADGTGGSFWYPSVTLNVEFKKHLLPGKTQWLYSRVQSKVVCNGRTDIDVTILDEEGDVVALSTQVGLIVSASRNIGKL
ncbi:hypothetical protein ASPZODRAFT_75347 [Penicilliopsis zonata CBS 506.65]|uniref:Thioesterase domain-containing protein n=1 Tax=Penicilliopsis zonata CBS 506.65 TaxID=1073090 RepID=A0A1L9S750_9EURO|nr:hypothetical protein ASPZODRAFT_75347 [Penicilliopsis zonata CBS 506.65]OJJ42985.1 hypothetical protein ASPZODRAFT_75347 [Penicilliopsis zonata CBS 506.65]